MTKEQEQNPYLPQKKTALISWKDLANLSTPAAQRILPYDFCKKHKILPLNVIRGDQDFLTVITSSQPSLEIGRELRFLAGMEVELETVHVESLGNAIDAAFLGSRNAINLAAEVAASNAADTRKKVVCLDLFASDAPIPKLLESLLSRGIALEASDVHLEYSGNTSRLRYRIDGRLKDEPIDELSVAIVSQLLRRIKILAGIDVLEVSKPGDGAFEFNIQDFSCSLRVSAIPIVEGEKIVIRYLENSNPIALDSLGLSQLQLSQLKSSLSANSGCILLSGPTGSGKTTLLYSSLEYLKRPELNIVTIEDPVEKRIHGLSQLQVDKVNQLGFAELLESLLRQDPDIIMIGEIRESVTAKTALNASLTGHLVLSTVHASNVFEIILRMKQLVSDLHLLTRPLRLLSSQRLLPKICPHCPKETFVTQTARKFLGLSHTEKLYQGAGCNLCHQTGIRGRVGVYEFLPVTDSFKEALLAQLPTQELLNLASGCGYLPYQFSVREHLISGTISPYEALRALGVPVELCK